jgi:hypothetical protein
MTTDPKRAKFEWCRKSLATAGISTNCPDAIICPLCWHETRFDNLTLEHIVPESVGGRQTTLTCRSCNNDHGSELDAHLAQYQTVRDALQGHGMLKTKLNINGHEMVANLKWGDGHKNFHVVGKATNPSAEIETRKEFSAGNVSNANFTLYFDYKQNNFQTAVLRAAYLVLFKCFGYEYASKSVTQAIRHRIVDSSHAHPNLASLIIELRDFTPPYDAQHYVVRGNVNGVEFFLVIIRVRRVTTTYLGAYLPVPAEHCEQFFDLMEQCAKEHNGEKLTIPIAGIFG